MYTYDLEKENDFQFTLYLFAFYNSKRYNCACRLLHYKKLNTFLFIIIKTI